MISFIIFATIAASIATEPLDSAGKLKLLCSHPQFSNSDLCSSEATSMGTAVFLPPSTASPIRSRVGEAVKVHALGFVEKLFVSIGSAVGIYFSVVLVLRFRVKMSWVEAFTLALASCRGSNARCVWNIHRGSEPGDDIEMRPVKAPAHLELLTKLGWTAGHRCLIEVNRHGSLGTCQPDQRWVFMVTIASLSIVLALLAIRWVVLKFQHCVETANSSLRSICCCFGTEASSSVSQTQAIAHPKARNRDSVIEIP